MAQIAVDANDVAVHNISRRRPWRIALAAVAFLIYASTVFILPQVRDSRYCCEQSSFAAAVSHIMYGSRIGSMYTGVFDTFMTHFTEPLPQTLEAIRDELPAQPTGRLSPTTLDGNGVGYPLVATAAFWLFGLHWWAPIAVMLILMAASMAAFLRRFSPTLVTFYFSGLTAMLFTGLVANPVVAGQVPVGGIRYFSLVGILPLFHILLSLMERHPSGAAAPLAIQTAILTIAALTRGSAVTGLIAIAAIGLVLARDRTRRPALIRKLATIGVAGLTVVVPLALAVPPQWFESGRFQTIVWSRATKSLGMNPDLPIAELNKMYPCEKYVPGGLHPGIGDDGLGCIWVSYVIKHNVPLEALWDKTFDGEFETVMRDAFFNIITKYPFQTLQTFAYYKPRAIVLSVINSLKFDFSGDPTLSILLLLASLGIAVATAVTASEIGRGTTVVLLVMLFNSAAYMVANANQFTAADLSLCCLIITGLGLGAAGSRVSTLIGGFKAKNPI